MTDKVTQPKIRPFLKWPGGKFRLCQTLKEHLPTGNTYMEPFLGAGAVFLNTHYQNMLLNDINPDLITLYKLLQRHGDSFIQDCKTLFHPKHNQPDAFYAHRERFNDSNDKYERSLLFLYLNRFGYNGLCRYNSSGGFNVPFGRYDKPYFPEKEMLAFYEKSQNAQFFCEDFKTHLKRAKKGMVIYCDPPYVPLNLTSSFTNYAKAGFTIKEQEILAQTIEKLQKKGASILVSNHDTPLTRKLYKNAKIMKIAVKRSISCKERGLANEIMALFKPLS